MTMPTDSSWEKVADYKIIKWIDDEKAIIEEKHIIPPVPKICKPTEAPVVEEPKVILPYQSKVEESPFVSRVFTVLPIDISDNTIYDRSSFVSRRVINVPMSRPDSCVLICSSCGRAISDNKLCKNCFPYGQCSTCHGPIAEDGVCYGCHQYGICNLCHEPRIVANLCTTEYCQNQGPVSRCKICSKPLNISGECNNKSCAREFSCRTSSCNKYCKTTSNIKEDEDCIASSQTFSIACDLWKIKKEINLAEEAVNFYVAWGLSDIFSDEIAAEILYKQVKRITPEFASYFDLAVGGELRHTMRYNGRFRTRIPKWLQHEFPCSKARPCAWLRWKDVRDEYGLSALAAAVECFQLPGWPGSFGGANWANIAQTLLDYLSGESSPIVFLDQAFSLEHNCGCAFNKVYAVGGLTQALNVCFESKHPADIVKSTSVGQLVSPELKTLVDKHVKK